jgi:glycosyltransferase involved in cell wall biosynthesis
VKVLAFSKNLVYGVGGAERSLFEELKKQPIETDITLTSVNGVKSFNANNLKLTLPPAFKVSMFDPKVLTSRFFFNEYLLNRKVIGDFISREGEDYDELWAQNIWAPIAINSFGKKTVYFARDESFLNIRPNYHHGFKRYAKKFYDLIDSPGFSSYCRDNRKAIENADEVIANSIFMAGKIKEKFGRDSKVIYPFIDKKTLKQNYENIKVDVPECEKGIVLLGDSKIKGIDTVLRLADDFPLEIFYIFSRTTTQPLKRNNIIYMPWVRSCEDAYKFAKIVIVPSICQEAYGRVAAESLALDIPCLVRDIGGLPEAVKYNQSLIAMNYQDFKIKLTQLLKNQ